MFKRHCSDERLLAMLDAEMDAASRRTIARHLQSCWKCREQLCKLENEFRSLSRSWGDTGLVSSGEVDQARNRFLAWTRTQAFEFRRDVRLRMRLSAIFRVPVMAAVGAFLLIGGVTVWKLEMEKPAAPQIAKQVPTSSGPRPIERAQPRTHPLKEVARLDHAVAPIEFPQSGPTAAQLLEAEVETWWLLHHAGACRGEPIEVTTRGDHIVVHGLVASRKRRRELAAALKEEIAPQLIRIELRTPEDAAADSNFLSSAISPPPIASPPNRDLGFRRAVAAALRDAYPLDTPEEGRHRLVGLANRAVRQAEDAIAEAWAIRRLGERFHGEGSVNLSAHSRRLFETMVKEHLAALHSHATELNSFLSPILFRIAPEQHSLATPIDLFATVERLRLLVQTSLAGDSSLLGSPAEVSGEIASLSQFLSDDLADVDVVLARMFPSP
jgi:hypothetical protein